MKALLSALMLVSLCVAGCVALPPGHDPNGPGNSEHAPGHNKKRH